MNQLIEIINELEMAGVDITSIEWDAEHLDIHTTDPDTTFEILNKYNFQV